MINPTKLDCLRMAAFIDCEGCIQISRDVRSGPTGFTHILRVSVANTDPRMPLWCKENFGGSVCTDRTPARNSRYALVAWSITGSNAEDVLRKCLPYFLIKREQADIAIAFRKTFHGKTVRWDRGHVAQGIPPHHQIKPKVLAKREQFRLQLVKARGLGKEQVG